MRAPALADVWKARYTRPFFVLLGLNLLVFPFTFYRATSERRLSAEAVGLREQIQEQRKAAAEIGRQLQIIKANGAETRRFYSEIVHGRESLVGTLKDLVKLASDLGIATPRMGYDMKEVKDADLTAVEISMPMSGTYQQLGALLQKLERTQHFVVLRSVGMRGRPSSGAPSARSAPPSTPTTPTATRRWLRPTSTCRPGRSSNVSRPRGQRLWRPWWRACPTSVSSAPSRS
jgi:hypothetical protein